MFQTNTKWLSRLNWVRLRRTQPLIITGCHPDSISTNLYIKETNFIISSPQAYFHAEKTHDACAEACEPMFIGHFGTYKSRPCVGGCVLNTKTLSLSQSRQEKFKKMPVHRFYLYLMHSICLQLACCHQLSHVENELRDLVTQHSVIRRAEMSAVIKDFRDGTIATVKWPSLIETAFELDRASEELLWYIHILEQLNTYNSKYKPLLRS